MPSLHPPRDIDTILREGYKVDIGARVNEGIEIFKAKMQDLLIFGAVMFGVAILLGISFAILYKILGYVHLGRLSTLLQSVVMQVVMTVAGSALLRYLFGHMRGDKVGINDFLVIDDQTTSFVTLGLITGAIEGVLNAIGLVIFPLIGLVFGLLTVFALPLVVDRSMPPVDALKASINLFLKNPLEAFILMLVCGILCVLGLFVAGIGLAGSVFACAYAHSFGLSGVASSDEGAV